MKNRKAGLNFPTLIISIFLLVAAIGWFWPNFSEKTSEIMAITAQDTPNKLYRCWFENKDENWDKKLDIDQDGLPNSCDNCPLTKNTIGKHPIAITEAREGVFKRCEKTSIDQDADCFPIGCCGNSDDKYTDPKNIAKHNPTSPWCGKKAEDDTNKGKHPKYIANK